MENVFVLIINSLLIGVYTSHRKAVQAMIMETLPYGYTMTDYTFDFGVEFYTFSDPAMSSNEKVYELHEVTPDTRA
jgi:hypothetical protein